MGNEVQLTSTEIQSELEKIQAKIDELKDMEKKITEKSEELINTIITDENCLYVFTMKGIGDFLISGGLSYAVRQRKNKDYTVFIVQERMKNSGVYFPTVDKMISMPLAILGALVKYFHDTRKYEGDNYIYGDIRKGADDFIWDKDLNMINRLKKNAFKVPLDAPFISPVVMKISDEKIQALHEKYIIDQERTVILCPYAKTFENMSTDFWETLVQRLKAKNYVVYTNIAKYQETVDKTPFIIEKPIKGTEIFSANFDELNYLAGKIKCFVGLRSGIFDFLAMTDARIINVIPFPHWYWDISVMYPECHNCSFYSVANYKKGLDKAVENFGVTIKNKFAHKYITDEKIFYNDKDILNALLNEIEKL